MPGAQCTRSLACKNKKAYERSHHGHTGITRHSPHNGFTVSFVLSPASRALLPPSSAVCLRQLDTGVRVSGPHDFAVRRLHVRQRAALTSTASRPASVTIASRPLWKERDRASIFLKSDLVKYNSEIPKWLVTRNMDSFSTCHHRA